MPTKIKISKSGYEVIEENNPNNLIFDSSLNHLKTKTAGSFTQSVADTDTYTKTITHGLTYKPLVMAFWRDTANSRWFITSADPEQTIGRYSIGANCSLYVDDTFVYIKIWNYTGSTVTFEVRYEIFYEGES